jgi:hypothetical protein
LRNIQWHLFRVFFCHHKLYKIIIYTTLNTTYSMLFFSVLFIFIFFYWIVPHCILTLIVFRISGRFFLALSKGGYPNHRLYCKISWICFLYSMEQGRLFGELVALLNNLFSLAVLPFLGRLLDLRHLFNHLIIGLDPWHRFWTMLATSFSDRSAINILIIILIFSFPLIIFRKCGYVFCVFVNFDLCPLQL